MRNLKKPFTTLLLTAFIGLSTGCATSQQHEMKYDDSKSLALNIVNNAGINPYGKIKDTEVPVGVKKHIGNTTEFGALNSVVRYNLPVSGVSGLAAGGLGVLEMMTAAKELSETPHLLGWIPANTVDSADEAQKVFLKQGENAVKKVLKDLNVKLLYENIVVKRKYMAYQAGFEGMGECNLRVKGKTCYIQVFVTKPSKHLSVIPAQLDPSMPLAYVFKPSGVRDVNSQVMIEIEGVVAQHPEILKAIADYMPSNSAIYAPPMTKKEAIGTNYPYVLKNGQIELFVTEAEK